MESDCKEAVELCNAVGKEGPWEMEAMLEEIHRLRNSNPLITIEYMPRKINRVADWLSKNSSALNFDCNRFQVHPSFIAL